MKLKMFVTIALVGAVAPVAAQEAGLQSAQERAVAVKVLAEKIAVEGQQRMAVEARFTAGAPYSGEAINESLQVLADGNRISKKTVTRIYRDSEGRTRRETIGADGQVASISITDPTAGTTYVLDPQAKTAFRNGLMMVAPDGAVSGTLTPASAGVVRAVKLPDGSVAVEGREIKEATEVRARTVAGARGGGGGEGTGPATATFSGSAGGGGRGGLSIAYPAMAVTRGKTTTDNLGQQVVEGVMSTGTRSTTVIEAGAIGNEQPIQIVSEQWTATDLKLLVMTKHSDPRSGDSTYRLTNITQAEQPRSLFDVPPDYTLKESTFRIREDQK